MKKIILVILVGVCHQFLISQENLKEHYNLMPWPADISDNNTAFKINETLTISISGEDSKKK